MPVDLIPDIRTSLIAKRKRLLSRPLIGRIRTRADTGEREIVSEPDGTFIVGVEIDYEVRWRNRERDVELELKSAWEMPVALLTDHQRCLLETSPGELFDRVEGPIEVTLVEHRSELVGGSLQLASIRVGSEPSADARHVAVLPNLLQIQRQLQALEIVETSIRPALAPLQALVGRFDPRELAREPRAVADVALEGARLDPDQRAAVERAMATPHFSVIEGPPGAGKTTVITEIIRRSLAIGERVLVVSPTHSAVDNVVEKLVPDPKRGTDDLSPTSLPVRYAARRRKLTARAEPYWVGPNGESRGATIATRVASLLARAHPEAESLLSAVDPNEAPITTLSAAIARSELVLCGTPIGLLSFDPVRAAEPGQFDCLIVDEVSKMSIAEFLAIAVKARRWVLVGDAAQLPPFNEVEANGDTLLDLLPGLSEMLWSIRALLEPDRDDLLLAVARDPSALVAALTDERWALHPRVHVCGPDDVDQTSEALAAREPAPLIRVLVERDLPAPTFPAGSRRLLVEPRERAPALAVERAATTYLAAPWARRADQSLRALERRPLLPDDESLVRAIALRFAVNTISVYDWLAGSAAWSFEGPVVRELRDFASPDLDAAVRPYVRSLTRQYRMARGISRVPRELFYFDEALQDGDGIPDAPAPHVRLIQVQRGSDDPAETNSREAQTIEAILAERRAAEREETRMVITPYRKQEAHLQGLKALSRDEICTLDRCQGREADVVFISLVTGRPSAFLDSPKRWNVALTRAKRALYIVGDIDAYRRQARDARTRRRIPTMSVVARVIEAYDRAARTEVP